MQVSIGQKATRSITLTADHVKTFAALSGDYNPLHFDESFAVFKKHIGFYPMPSAIKAFTKELTKYKTAKGSIQFPHDKPLPLTLIKKIVRFHNLSCTSAGAE